jgi:hydroxylamine reductase
MSAPGGCGAAGQLLGTCGKNETLARLQDTMIFGLKGLAAYRAHAREMGVNTAEVDDIMGETLYFTLTNVNFNLNDHLAQLMKVGEAGVKMMDLLSEAHTQELGIPTPVKVTNNKAEGKAILVTGHNLLLLKKLLEATAGKGINIYTHSEMLPAHGYPELRKYPHLKGNIGKSWFDQTSLFEKWQGAILVNTNCIVPPRKNCGYLDRLFTYQYVGIEGARKIEGEDFSELIATALNCPEITGFDSEETIMTGHHYKTLLSEFSPAILSAIKEGKISRFFVVAGCDAPGPQGNYFREFVQGLPEDCVILTTSCGKFRFNDIDFGTVPGTSIPRYLDLGQCNDSNGAVHIALTLSKVLNIPVNDLPVSIVLSWMEQKAVLILSSLLYLGIKNITIGPKTPVFFNQEILEFLVSQFNLNLTSTPEADRSRMLAAV